MMSGRVAGTSCAESRVASERMNTLGPLPAQGPMAFIRMRSPSNAPPVLRREGSTHTTPMVKSSPWSMRRRRINSSVRLDLPAPPVPVMPNTGVLLALACSRITSKSAAGTSSRSRRVISWVSSGQLLAKALMLSGEQAVSIFLRASRTCAARAIISPIMPSRPIF